MSGYEVNFDGLVGLTHHYAGLSFGNEASTQHQNSVSNPKLAAKQGLLKMKALADLGFQQGYCRRRNDRTCRCCASWVLAAATKRSWRRR